MTQLSGHTTDWSVDPANGGSSSRVLPALVASAVFFVVGLAGLAFLGPSEAGGYDACIIEESGKLAREGSGIRWEANPWPPGVRCIYSHPDGPDVSVVKPATVGQYTFLAALCGAAGTLTAHLAPRVRRRCRRRS